MEIDLDRKYEIGWVAYAEHGKYTPYSLFLLSNSFMHDFSFTNSSLLGWVIYTYTFEIFLIVSLLLLVAMVGSIVLVLNQNVNVKRQVIFKQVAKSFSASLSLKNRQ